MDILIRHYFMLLFWYLAALAIVVLIGVRRGSWLRRTENNATLFRMPQLLAILPAMLALLIGSMMMMLLYTTAQEAATYPAHAVRSYAKAGLWALYLGFMFASLCWSLAPTELEVDLAQRRYRHTQRLFRKTQVTCGTLEDFSGICSSRGGCVMLVFRARKGSLYGYRLGTYYGSPEKAAEKARELARLVDLPVVPVPWR